MKRRRCILERRLGRAAKARTFLSERTTTLIRETCGCPACVAALRVVDIRRENANREPSIRITIRNRCPSCGCSPFARCVLRLDGGDLGRCAAVNELAGHKTCSGCLTPDRRVAPELWNLPDAATAEELRRGGVLAPETIAKLEALGLLTRAAS